MEEFVSFELAKKLKEKGFEIPTRSIVAMYNEQGVFFTLTTAADYQVSPSGYKCRCYYDYDDFDEHDYIAPTISQVLKWLRDEKKVFVEIALSPEGYRHIIYTGIYRMITPKGFHFSFDGFYNMEELNYMDYKIAAIEGIEYVLNNLI